MNLDRNAPPPALFAHPSSSRASNRPRLSFSPQLLLEWAASLAAPRGQPMSDMRDAIVVLLAGGQGERLWPLTRDRAKPAVPFGALYRIIDITLSNCINSTPRRIFILTQYKALSLNRHIRAGWSPLAGLGDYIEVLAPQMRVSQQWYQGTADAVYQNIYSIGSERSKFVFILSGDHIYKMNYAKMLQQHLDSGAEVTVATIQIPVEQAARQFGVIEVDQDWRIVGFEEKPGQPKQSPHHPGHCNASMGIYIFNTQLMIPILLADSEDPKSHHDFGKDILPRIISKHRVFAYNFVDENSKDALYWRDVGTIDAPIQSILAVFVDEVVGEDAVLRNDARKDVLAEIVMRLGILGIGKKDGDHQLRVEDVNAHGGVAMSGVVWRLLRRGRLFLEADDTPILIHFDHAQLLGGLLYGNLDNTDGHICAGVHVLIEHLGVIHLVDVIAGENENKLRALA